MLHSEWIKLWSLRSTDWSFALVIVVSVGMAALLSLSTQWDQSGVPLAPESVIGWVAVSGVVGALLLERRDA